MRQRPCRPPASKTLLWIDDYEPGLALYKAVFEGFGFNVLTASGGRKGLDLAASHDFDAVVVDYEMPEMDGGEVAAELKSSCPDLPIVMFTGSDAIYNRRGNLVEAVCDQAGWKTEHLASIRVIIIDCAVTTFVLSANKDEGMAALNAA